MKSLTKEGQQTINEIAAKYGLKTGSVEAMAEAVIRGNGTMAQFNIPELGGQGQWMKGGMTMVGDMFNNSLKLKVDQLCTELAGLVSSKVIFEETGESASLGKAGSGTDTWPSVFGSPTASGSQNNFKYAYFAKAKRLVIEEAGQRKIYDTKHHQITGVSQQQGGHRTYQFTTNEGPVDLGSLTLVSEPGEGDELPQKTPEMVYDVSHSNSIATEKTSQTPEDIIIATIEKVNLLFERGKITEEEFKAKKKELLAKL